jgi:hypothetical protein
VNPTLVVIVVIIVGGAACTQRVLVSLVNKRGTSDTGIYLIMLVALAGAMTLRAPVPGALTDALLGTHTSWLIEHQLVVVATWCGQAFLLVSIEEDRPAALSKAGHRALVMAGVIAAIMVLFARNSGAAVFGNDDSGTTPASASTAIVVCSSYLVNGTVLSGRAMWRWGTRAIGLRWLAGGLLVASLGCLLTAVSNAYRVMFQVALLAGYRLPVPDVDVECWLVTPGGALVMLGLSSSLATSAISKPLWRPLQRLSRPGMAAIRRMSGVRRSRVSRRALLPLWSAFVAANAVVPHQAPLSRAPRRLHDLVIDLWDGYRKLRALAPEPLTEQATQLARKSGLNPDAATIVAEATGLAAALILAPAVEAARPSTPVRPPMRSSALSDEITWWLAVADAMRCSPIVAALHRHGPREPYEPCG